MRSEILENTLLMEEKIMADLVAKFSNFFGKIMKLLYKVLDIFNVVDDDQKGKDLDGAFEEFGDDIKDV